MEKVKKDKMDNLTANVEAYFTASPQRVWDALTNPELIEQYFFGTQAVSDWQVGSSLQFMGEWEGQAYLDKGTILQSDSPKIFQYDYLSSMSGLEDKPENYAIITYALTSENEGTRLVISQTGITNEERREHSEANWKFVLDKMREIL